MAGQAQDAKLPNGPFSPADIQPVTNSMPQASNIDTVKSSEESVIMSALAGDERAYEDLFHRYRDRVLAICRRYCNGDAAQAHDLCQETFIKAFHKLGGLRDRSRFFYWLAEIARNKCVSFIREQTSLRKNLQDYRDIEHVMSDHQEQWTEAEAELISELIRAMENPELRETARLFYIEGKKTAEVARIQSISQTAVTTRLNRFRTRLKKRMAQEILKRRGGPS